MTQKVSFGHFDTFTHFKIIMTFTFNTFCAPPCLPVVQLKCSHCKVLILTTSDRKTPLLSISKDLYRTVHSFWPRQLETWFISFYCRLIHNNEFALKDCTVKKARRLNQLINCAILKQQLDQLHKLGVQQSWLTEAAKWRWIKKWQTEEWLNIWSLCILFCHINYKVSIVIFLCWSISCRTTRKTIHHIIQWLLKYKSITQCKSEIIPTP